MTSARCFIILGCAFTSVKFNPPAVSYVLTPRYMRLPRPSDGAFLSPYFNLCCFHITFGSVLGPEARPRFLWMCRRCTRYATSPPLCDTSQEGRRDVALLHFTMLRHVLGAGLQFGSPDRWSNHKSMSLEGIWWLWPENSLQGQSASFPASTVEHHTRHLESLTIWAFIRHSTLLAIAPPHALLEIRENLS